MAFISLVNKFAEPLTEEWRREFQHGLPRTVAFHQSPHFFCGTLELESRLLRQLRQDGSHAKQNFSPSQEHNLRFVDRAASDDSFDRRGRRRVAAVSRAERERRLSIDRAAGSVWP